MFGQQWTIAQRRDLTLWHKANQLNVFVFVLKLKCWSFLKAWCLLAYRRSTKLFFAFSVFKILFPTADRRGSDASYPGVHFSGKRKRFFWLIFMYFWNYINGDSTVTKDLKFTRFSWCTNDHESFGFKDKHENYSAGGFTQWQTTCLLSRDAETTTRPDNKQQPGTLILNVATEMSVCNRDSCAWQFLFLNVLFLLEDSVCALTSRICFIKTFGFDSLIVQYHFECEAFV